MPENEQPNPAEPTVETPPWGESFDAERAWTLIQNLKSDKATLQSKIDAAKTELDAAKADTETERQAREAAEAALAANPDPEGKIAAAEARAADAEKGLFRERALRKFPTLEALGDDVADFLTGDDEASILAKAERLSSLGTPPAKEPKGEVETPSTPTPARPEPELKLTPGQGDTPGPQPVDLDAVASAARSRR